MKISFIKYKEDKNRYKIAEGFGMEIVEINKPEEIDDKIEELKKQQYTTIVIPDELASFSEKLIKNYQYDPKINIVITPNKKNN